MQRRRWAASVARGRGRPGCETVRGEGERTIGRRRKRGRLKPCARRVVNCRICPRTMAVCCFSVAVDRQTGRNGTRQRGSPGNTHGGTFYSTSTAAGRRLERLRPPWTRRMGPPLRPVVPAQSPYQPLKRNPRSNPSLFLGPAHPALGL
jgi:hypothetical protein